MNETQTATRRFRITARPYYTVDSGARYHDTEHATRPDFRAEVGDYLLVELDRAVDAEGDIRGTLERTGKTAYVAMAVLVEVDTLVEGEPVPTEPEDAEAVIPARIVRAVLVLVGMDEFKVDAFIAEVSK